MSTVATIIARQPQAYQDRYGDSYWIGWINDLLEELSGEGFLMPSLDRETGLVVADKIWITKPSGLRAINNIHYPTFPDIRYTYKEVENKIKLLSVEIDAEESPDTADAFQNYAVGSMDIDIADADEDDYKDYLLVIDGGTSSGDTIILSGNDAAAAGYTKVYFYHDLATVLDGTKITSCYLTQKKYYVVVEHSATYDEVIDGTTEVPINDKYERRITKAWLRWKIEEQVSAITKETEYFEKQYYATKLKLKAELRSNIGRRIQPRVMPGLDQYSDVDYSPVIFDSDVVP